MTWDTDHNSDEVLRAEAKLKADIISAGLYYLPDDLWDVVRRKVLIDSWDCHHEEQRCTSGFIYCLLNINPETGELPPGFDLPDEYGDVAPWGADLLNAWNADWSGIEPGAMEFRASVAVLMEHLGRLDLCFMVAVQNMRQMSRLSDADFDDEAK